MNAKYRLVIRGEHREKQNKYYEIGKEYLNDYKASVRSSLKGLLKADAINGDELQNAWFPEGVFKDEPFLFLSHSHRDEPLAIALAGFLRQHFQINCFVDSCIWNYADDLIAMLNSKAGLSAKDSFGYVNMMLASALMNMMDKSECIFFLDTPKSVNRRDKTESAWIYYELNIAHILRTRKPKLVSINEKSALGKKTIEFTPLLKDMVEIDENVLAKWSRKFDPKYDDPYDILRELTGENHNMLKRAGYPY